MSSSFCLSKHYHPSRSEADYCNWLLWRKQQGQISDYKLYPKVELHVNGKLWRNWAIDFKVIEKDGGISYHESKGWSRSDDRFRMKLGHFRLEYPDIPIYVNRKLVTGKGWRNENNYKTNKRIDSDYWKRRYAFAKKLKMVRQLQQKKK